MYVGAIAILFLFIIMMVPIKERHELQGGWLQSAAKVGVLVVAYLGGCALFRSHLVSSEVNKLSEFWLAFGNQLDQQSRVASLPNRTIEGITLSDLYQSDIALYGARLYQEAAYPILLTGLVLLFVLVAAIVLCKEE